MTTEHISYGVNLKHTPDEIMFAEHDPTITLHMQMTGPSNLVTGYGTHFVELVRALIRMGHDVHVWPMWTAPPLPHDFLTTIGKEWDNTADVGICMADPYRLERIARHTIGMTTWETSKLPESPELRRSLSAVDEFIVPCQYNIALFQSLEPEKPITVVPEGVDTTFYLPAERDWNADPLKIGILSAANYRKGIDMALEAFIDLYLDNPHVELHVATSQLSGMPALPSIANSASNIFYYKFGGKTKSEVRDWYSTKHALLAPSRGEGWYLPGTEFMATGGILICPDKQGFAEYVSPQACVIIDSYMGPVDQWHHLAGHRAAIAYGEWICYEEGAVKDALRRFVEMNPADRAEMSTAAIADIHFHCPWEQVAERVTEIFINAYKKQVGVG